MLLYNKFIISIKERIENSDYFINDVKVMAWSLYDLMEVLKDQSLTYEDEYGENNLFNVVKDDLNENLAEKIILNYHMYKILDSDADNWKEIRLSRIKELREIHINEKDQEILAKTMDAFKNYSPLMKTSYLKAGLEGRFEEEISKLLYAPFNEKHKGTSGLLKSLSKLCIPRRNNIVINSVIIYNFDDLLEVNLDEYSITYKSLYNETTSLEVNELPIYHVYGFIPRDVEGYTDLSELLLIFSED